MKRFAIFITSIIFALGLTSCTDKEPDRPIKDEVVETAPEPTREEVFLRVLRDETDAWDNEADAEVVDLAKSMCEAWGRDASFTDVAAIFLQTGYTPREGGGFIGAGTQAFCPEYSYKYEQ